VHEWRKEGKTVTFIRVNPATADAQIKIKGDDTNNISIVLGGEVALLKLAEHMLEQ